MHIYPEAEVRAAWGGVLTTRERVAKGVADWSEVAKHFTEDAIYIDPVWGRYVGSDAIASQPVVPPSELSHFGPTLTRSR